MYVMSFVYTQLTCGLHTQVNDLVVSETMTP